MKCIDQLVGDIESKYQKELNSYNPTTKKVKGVDMCAILMARGLLERGKIWWYSWENIGIHDEFFGSHKIPARMSDLAIKYPQFFESREVGKYTIYRIRFEKLSQEILIEMTRNTFKVSDLCK